MVEEELSREALIKRLRRVEGQIRGIEKMIESERDCESVITQLAAVRSAIESVGVHMLNNCMNLCLSRGIDNESVGIDSLARCVAIWGRVRVGEGRR